MSREVETIIEHFVYPPAFFSRGYKGNIAGRRRRRRRGRGIRERKLLLSAALLNETEPGGRVRVRVTMKRGWK